MGFGLDERTVRPLTADEVMRMVELGILPEDEPVELLHGALTEVSAKTPGHEAVKMRLHRWLAPAVVGGRCDLRLESPLVVPDRTSLPEPDIAVIERDDAIAHPRTALLVIEVAVSSLKTDTRVKPALYAAASVGELWVVDVPAQRLEVFAVPGPGGYADHTVMTPPSLLTPRFVPVGPLDLATLLAGLPAGDPPP